jgi:hypothetical protein
MSSGKKGRVKEFSPCLGLGLDVVYPLLLLIQTRRVLEFMEEHTGRILGPINHNGVWTTWIRIATIDMLGPDRLTG